MSGLIRTYGNLVAGRLRGPANPRAEVYQRAHYHARKPTANSWKALDGENCGTCYWMMLC